MNLNEMTEIGTTAVVKRRVTPSDARELLKLNYKGNRPVRKTVVETYTQDMLAGRWNSKVSDPIAVESKGGKIKAVYNGQHRLEAIARANVAVDMYFCEANESDYKYMDNGLKRSTRDYLNCPYPGKVASLSKVAGLLEIGTTVTSALEGKASTGSKRVLSRQEHLDIISELGTPTLLWYVRKGMAIQRSIGKGGDGRYADAMYIIHKTGNDDCLYEFVEDLCKPFPESKSANALKTYVLKMYANNKYTIKSVNVVLPFLCAYDNYVNGDEAFKITDSYMNRVCKEYDAKIKEIADSIAP